MRLVRHHAPVPDASPGNHDGGSAEQRRARTQKEGSLLDSVLEETRSLTARLGRSDTSKLREYLDSVREVEQRIRRREDKQGLAFEKNAPGEASPEQCGILAGTDSRRL